MQQWTGERTRAYGSAPNPEEPSMYAKGSGGQSQRSRQGLPRSSKLAGPGLVWQEQIHEG